MGTEELTTMTNEERKTKYAPLVTDPWVLHGVIDINHRPHPYTVGSRHVQHAAEHCGGMLGDATMQAIGCAHPRCGLSVDEHVSDKVIALKLSRNCTNDEASAVLKPLASQWESDGIDGMIIVDTPEKFRVTAPEGVDEDDDS